MMRSTRLVVALLILAGGCLVGCGRASPSGTAAENILPPRAAQPAAAAHVAAEAIDVGAAEDLVNAARNDLNDSAFWRLGSDAERLNELPSYELGTNIAAQRDQELSQLEDVLFNRWAARLAASRLASVSEKAKEVLSEYARDVPERFMDALYEVTEDAIRGVACKEIFDLSTVVLDPGTTNLPDDINWKGDIIIDVKRIIGGSLSANIGLFMSWYYWSSDVYDFAGQASQAFMADQPAYLNILGKPDSLRAAYAYVNYCYAPPAFKGSD